ncbi:uncharacterized protein LOC143943374 [Lithobates pipiens]
MGGHALNLPPPQAGLGLPPAMNIPPPQLSPTSGAEPRMPTSKPPSHVLNLVPPESESLGNSKPRKRSEPVRISVPELRGGDSDSEEDEPFRQKAASQFVGIQRRVWIVVLTP